MSSVYAPNVAGGPSLRFASPFALLDQFPKFPRFAELIVFRHWQFASEKKISQRVFVQHAMHSDAFWAALKIDAVIFRAITMQLFPFPFDYAEAAGIKVVEIFWGDLKLGEQIELECLRQSRHLGRAQLVEDDLEHGCCETAIRESLPNRNL
jgi:hypothetical protein